MIRDWLVPGGLRPGPGETDEQTRQRRARKLAGMNMGGLSLTRIATFTEFRRALLQFRTAGTPWGRIEVGTHGEPRFECDEDGTPRIIKREVPEKYAKALLGVIERLREQRVKQLASRIAEAALGIGRIEPGKNRDPERPSDRVDASCHAIVIKNLTNYRPKETRTPTGKSPTHGVVVQQGQEVSLRGLPAS